MRQLWVAAAILLVMVGLLSWNMFWLQEVTDPIREDLAQGAAAVQAGDWDQAVQRTSQAQQRWRQEQDRLRLVQVHGEIDEVSALLGELEGILAQRETGEYLAVNRRAAEKLESIQRSERLSLENLF